MKKQFGVLFATFLLFATGLTLAPVALGQSSIVVKAGQEAETFSTFTGIQGTDYRAWVEQVLEVDWTPDDSHVTTSYYHWQTSEELGQMDRIVTYSCTFEGVVDSVELFLRNSYGDHYLIFFSGVMIQTFPDGTTTVDDIDGAGFVAVDRNPAARWDEIEIAGLCTSYASETPAIVEVE